MEGQIKYFPDKVKLKEFTITKPLLYEMLEDLSNRRRSKTMNSELTTNSQVWTTEHKKKTKTKLSKQIEQEWNQRNGDHMEGFQGREEEGKKGGKV